ncbi:MAG TPA: hypothetical protein VHU40_18700, partial [Polyangia bacterium]|nr:hypothetical protein [Polyangia bacterium]
MRASRGRGSAHARAPFGAALTLTLALAAPPASAKHADPTTSFAQGVKAFHDDDYAQAETLLTRALGRPGKSAKDKNKDADTGGILNDDWLLYLRAESVFYAGSPARAREDFEKLAKVKSSRLATLAGFRAADCAWMTGGHADAAASYRKLLPGLSRLPKGHDSAMIDPVVARFRVALAAEEQRRPEAPRLFLALFREVPAHPLAAEARRHLTEVPPAEGGEPAKLPPAAVTVADRLKRAETLTHDRHWDLALEELAKLPSDLPRPQAVERDFQIGMTKFNMRRDYPQAAGLLLAVAPELTGDKAASALFHGTRALSRSDKDDEAIAGYKQV